MKALILKDLFCLRAQAKSVLLVLSLIHILLPDAEKQPLSVYLSTINTGEVGLAFAIATIYMVPTLLLFLHGEEYLVEGIATQGSVKG